MNDRFCPNCAAQLQGAETECPDCQFPLNIKVVTEDGGIRLRSGQEKAWLRLTQYLQRNGVRVETQAASDWTRRQAWLFLPGLGAFLLAISLIFGRDLAQAIWGAPVRPAVVDLNQPVEEAAEPESQASADAPADADAGADTSFLEKALRTTEDQRRLAEEETFDPSEYIDRPTLSAEAVLARARLALLEVRVDDEARRGVLLTSGGLFLVETEALNEAFKNEVRTVREAGSLIQKTVFVAPQVGRPGEPSVEARKLRESTRLDVTLMRADLGLSVDFPVDFDQPISIGVDVWLGLYRSDGHQVERHRIVDEWRSYQGGRVWVLDDAAIYPAVHSGSPLFDKAGRLVGVYLVQDGQALALSLLDLREIDPLMFKDIIND